MLTQQLLPMPSPLSPLGRSQMPPDVALTPRISSSQLGEPACGGSPATGPPKEATLRRGWGPPQQGAKHGGGLGLVGSMLG